MSVAGINSSEFVVLCILAAVLIGPEKLPQYARKLATLIRELRRLADGAQEQLRQELGDEFNELNLAKFNLRHYDPRSIIRDALLEESDDRASDGRREGHTPRDQYESTQLETAITPTSVQAPFDNEAT
ncbi:Sec-independent protein translocase TatB [Glutamicibacter sp.]|uniref:Sec-independent protein translocase TatB n=1 Tax=Glutamicibacter sp. TaxID=1931995 RepID=UPI002B45FF93|nr:Sec-independent protein translocase TatB [Glutamicibacter sp.]HJX77657.1 Sec-independent protein translocase TatB [Glutamicibacter sp.]